MSQPNGTSSSNYIVISSGNLIAIAGVIVSIGIAAYNSLSQDLNQIRNDISDFRNSLSAVILEYSPVINLKDNQGKSAIYKAIESKDTEAVISLIAAGADVNARDNEKLSPLHVAVITEQPEIVDKLIAAGADVNAKNDDDISALDIAINTEQPEVATELKVAGAMDDDSIDPWLVERSVADYHRRYYASLDPNPGVGGRRAPLNKTSAEG